MPNNPKPTPPSRFVVVAGNPGPIRVSTSEERTLTEPREFREQWRGELGATSAAFNALANGATRASFKQNGVMAEIDLVFKNETLVVDSVELDFHSVQRQWFHAPVYAVLTVQQRVTILGQLRRFAAYQNEGYTADEVTAEYNDIFDNLVPPLDDAFADVIQNGEEYQALLPSVTFTRTVSKYHPVYFEIYDMGLVFSTQRILGIVPTSTQYIISEVTNTVAANPLSTLGWLKSGRYGKTSDGSSQYVENYVFNSYPTARYTFI